MSVTPQTNCTLADIAEQLKSRDNFVICGHVSPDGDCLGSQLALMHALRALGKHAVCVYAKRASAPDGLDHMPGYDEIVPIADFNGVCDTFVSVDVQIEKRIGDALPLAQAAKYRITVDHHAIDDRFADSNYVDPDAAATCILIWELVALLGVAPSKAIATCCYTGMLTDTGSFQFSNADTTCFKAAAQMLDAGANPLEISASVYQSRRIESLMLERIMLEHMEVDETAGLAMSFLYADDFVQTGALPGDTETFIDVLRSLKCVRVACLLREQDGAVRGSMRVKDDTDVSVIARDLGGGGHVAAAGFTIEDSTIAESLERIRSRIYESLQQKERV